MKYMGSKRRIAKELIKVIQDDSGRLNGNWIEPFVGGANMIDKVSNERFSRYGYDVNNYLIELFNALQNGWTPPKVCTEETYRYVLLEYRAIRDNKPLPFGGRKFTDHELGFYGFTCSFGGTFMEGYARDKTNKRNFATEGHNNLMKQLPNIECVEFGLKSYEDINFSNFSPKRTIIYCDPPYRNTRKYKDGLDHEHFYNWCVDLSNKGFHVYISEYNMPEDKFECIWEKDLGRTAINNKEHQSNTRKLEKLFKVKGDNNVYV